MTISEQTEKPPLNASSEAAISELPEKSPFSNEVQQEEPSHAENQLFYKSKDYVFPKT